MVPAKAGAQGNVYVRGEVGFSAAGQVRFDVRSDPILDRGWMVGAAVGYDPDGPAGGIRVEGELSYRSSDIEGGGEMAAYALMANGLYDFESAGPIRPYLGAGLGYARMRHDFLIVRGKANALAWQALAGIGVPLRGGLTLDVGVRYFDANADFDDELDLPVGTVLPITEWRGGQRQAALTVGLRW